MFPHFILVICAMAISTRSGTLPPPSTGLRPVFFVVFSVFLYFYQLFSVVCVFLFFLAFLDFFKENREPADCPQTVRRQSQTLPTSPRMSEYMSADSRRHFPRPKAFTRQSGEHRDTFWMPGEVREEVRETFWMPGEVRDTFWMPPGGREGLK